MISIKENVNSIEEFNYLYDAVGWGSYDEKVSEKALANTMYSVSVYDDDKIIGYGRIIGDGICFLYIHDVMVIAKYQNKKIGTKLIEQMINDCRKNNVSSITLEVKKSNNNDIHLYEKIGFNKVSIRKGYYQGIDGILMEKELN